MKKLSADVCSVTHAGRVRRENEDNYSLNGRVTNGIELKKGSAYVQKMVEPFHLAVCDGMGGESYGELASGIAVETIAKCASNVYESGEDFSYAISNCLDKANTEICREINARGVRIGTTLAAVYAIKGKLICVSLGDTRIYRFSAGLLEQMSFDHTHAQVIVDAGAVPADEIGSIPDAKRLTKHLGVLPEEASLSPNISVVDDVNNGDVILLCSDGLTDMMTDEEIASVISSGENVQDVTGKLIRMALEKGGKDNITVVTALISAEETAIFAPIAEAMVGDNDPNYEEEYRESYGDGGQDGVSPYANADATASEKPIDKMKILKIAGLVLTILAVLAIAGLIIKAASGRDKNNTPAKTTTSLDEYYSQYQTFAETTTEISTWFTEAPTTEEPTEETTTGITTTNPVHTERPAPPKGLVISTVHYDQSKIDASKEAEKAKTEKSTEKSSESTSVTSSEKPGESDKSESTVSTTAEEKTDEEGKVIESSSTKQDSSSSDKESSTKENVSGSSTPAESEKAHESSQPDKPSEKPADKPSETPSPQASSQETPKENSGDNSGV